MGTLMADQNFWEHQSDGLLVCASAGQFRMFSLPIDTEEYVAVDDSYHVAPVLGILNDMQEFYVLSIAQHNPKLFKGNLYGLEDAGLELPGSVHAGLNIDENNQKSEQSQSAGGSSLNTAGFNGRGGARNPQEEDRMMFFRMIDKMIHDKTDTSLPLILAGIDAEVAEYRAISKHPQILEGSIAGSFRDAKPHDLFEPALAIIHQDVLQPHEEEAVAVFERLRGSNPLRVASNPEEIEAAAAAGRVDTLLMCMRRYTTDTVRDNKNAVMRITFPDKKLRNTANLLAQTVAKMSGKVINLDDRLMPHGASMAAILRY